MRHLVLTPDRNSKKTDGSEDNDFTGAFDPEARRYVAYWRGRGDEVISHTFNPKMPSVNRVALVLMMLKANTPLDRLAFFCHGWRTGIQAGLSCGDAQGRAVMVSFAEALVTASTPELKVALYACSTGSSNGPPGDGGDGGFADLLRDDLCAAGRPDVTVFAHTTAGHTTRNSAVRFFAGKGDPLGGYGGDDVVARRTAEFNKLAARLRSVPDDFRWRLPYMTPDEIHAELA